MTNSLFPPSRHKSELAVTAIQLALEKINQRRGVVPTDERAMSTVVREELESKKPGVSTGTQPAIKSDSLA